MAWFFLHNICCEKNDLPPEYWVFMFNKNWSAYKAMSFSLPKLSFLGHWFYEKVPLKNPVSWVTFPSLAWAQGRCSLQYYVFLPTPSIHEWMDNLVHSPPLFKKDLPPLISTGMQIDCFSCWLANFSFNGNFRNKKNIESVLTWKELLVAKRFREI